MFARLTVADLQLFRNESASSLSNTIVYEVQNGTTQLIGAVLSLLRDSLTLLALLAYLFYLNWQLTLIVLLVFPALTAVMRLLSRRLYHVTKRSQTATDALAYVVEENVLAHRIIRLHGAQAQQADRFDGFSQKLRGLALRATIASAAMTPITQLLAACALSTVIVVGPLAIQRGGRNGRQLCRICHRHAHARHTHSAFGRRGDTHHARRRCD